MTRTGRVGLVGRVGLMGLLIATSAHAKGATTRITITGPDLAAPIEITDPVVLEPFNVWGGRGTYVNGVPQNAGFIIDWAAGSLAAPPAGSRRYAVSFYVTERTAGSPQLAYVVIYAAGAAANEGFVFLPGRTDEEYALNIRSIYRGAGFEGHWFRATRAWLDAVRPLLAR